jgi:hypothetical protein
MDALYIYCHVIEWLYYGVWIGNCIYCTLTHPWLQAIISVSLIHTLYRLLPNLSCLGTDGTENTASHYFLFSCRRGNVLFLRSFYSAKAVVWPLISWSLPSNESTCHNIQSVPGGKVNILGGHNTGHSKQNICVYTRVLFRTVSETELFHCTVPKLLLRKRY